MDSLLKRNGWWPSISVFPPRQQPQLGLLSLKVSQVLHYAIIVSLHSHLRGSWGRTREATIKTYSSSRAMTIYRIPVTISNTCNFVGPDHQSLFSFMHGQRAGAGGDIRLSELRFWNCWTPIATAQIIPIRDVKNKTHRRLYGYTRFA
jgi:hypothetical protein